MSQYFITGTDTDVGKTQVACALMYLARQAGLTTAAVKPLAAGCEFDGVRWRNRDALQLQAQCWPRHTYQKVNPVAFAAAIAPHIAAAEQGVTVTAAALAAACREVLNDAADFTVIEGAGGWRVPLNDTETLADVASALALPVILVVGVRLGCINHALLTAEAIARDGLVLAGWVGNIIDPATDRLEANLATLQGHIPAPCLGVVPHLPQPSPAALGEYLSLDTLV